MLQSINSQSLVCRLLKAGYSTYSLAQAVGLSQPAVSRLARGVNKTTSSDVFGRLIALAGGEIHLPVEATAEGAKGEIHAATV